MRPELILENHSLRELNWWRVGGIARFFSAPRDMEELRFTYHWAFEQKLKLWVISGGSNILVRDGLLNGLVLSLHDFKGVISNEIKENSDGSQNVEIYCLAGTPKSDIAKIFAQQRLTPAIFLTGIPGDVGGGVVMNAGIGENRVPREFGEIVKEIEVLKIDEATGELSEHKLAAKALTWEYRHSSGWQPGIITRVCLTWPKVEDGKVANEIRTQTKKRVSTQPLDLPSCGSVFRNPLGHKSAQLIESNGLKGYRVGGACVSTKHANFIVNDKGATAADIQAIINHVRATVRENSGIELQTEVVVIGD